MIYEKVVDTIVDIMGFDQEEIKPSSLIYGELDADSLDISQIIIALENDYKISIDNDFIKEMETVQDLVDYIMGGNQ
jgi:acyl carrier protein